MRMGPIIIQKLVLVYNYFKDTRSEVFLKKYAKLRMLFKKNAKMVLITIPFISSLFKSLYYVEIAMEYDFNSLINKI